MAVMIGETSAPTTKGNQSAGRLRFEFLDGLRGLAALCVLIYHVVFALIPLVQFHAQWSQVGVGKLVRCLTLTNFLVTGYGPDAVVVFIVLSGYCLMLPVAQEASQQLKGGVAGFLRRRARRILPAYYAAVILGLTLIYLIPAMKEPNGAYWGLCLPAFSWGNVLAHLFLVHNWTPWIDRIDGPMWSIGVEWQIYFVFALMLLPCYRRFGLLVTVTTAFLLGMMPISLSHLFPSVVAWLPHISLSSAWLLGCFAFGMAAACVQDSSRLLNWKISAIVLILLSLFLRFHGKVHALHTFPPAPEWTGNYLTAGATACVLIYCAQRSAIQNPKSILLKLLGHPIAVLLGSFSYSLYLTHTYVLWLLEAAFMHRHLSSIMELCAMAGVGIPASIGFGYLFSLAFERPFMPGRPKTIRQAEAAAILSPAP